MFNPTELVIESYVDTLAENYFKVFGMLEPEFPNILKFCGRIALENIANSDAAYHDLNHTILVTEVGQEILRCKQLSEGGVSPSDWLHFVIALLCHDIGYVRGICNADRKGSYVIDFEGNTFSPPPGATDAALTPYHVIRSQLFVRERFANVPVLDTQIIEQNIEYTIFPVPTGEASSETKSYPALLRSADLIGQMADIDYLKKCSALFTEFRETGAAEKMGYKTPDDLRKNYPKFFWAVVAPLISDAIAYLQVTQAGKACVNNLFANVFIEEHGIHTFTDGRASD